jgi:magnesium-dependent phosphatase 1
LWNAGGTWCDCTTPPYKLENGIIRDSYGLNIRLYPDALEIINELKRQNCQLALASRTEEPTWAIQLLELFNIRHLFDFEEIYPTRKTVHLKSIQDKSGIPFNNMVFFDDEYRNIEDVSKLGVHCILVNNGIAKLHIQKFLN